MFVIKLGGSVITDKTEYRRFRTETVARLASEIKESGQRTMIVHGAGSFGHIVSKQYALMDGIRDDSQIPAAARVMADTRELSAMVVEELLKAGIPAVSVPPGSCFVLEDGRLDIGDDEPIRRLFSLGIVPVMFGDVCTDRVRGMSIVSGDQIMERICAMFDPEEAVFVSDIDGLFDRDPKTHPDAEIIRRVTREALDAVDSGSDVADVTGGIRGKMESMLRMTGGSRRCFLVNGNAPGRLLSVLKGEDVICTVAEGGME